VLTALAAGPPVAAAAPTGQKLVVVFYPNESDRAPGLILADHAIRSTFAAEAPWRVEVRNEYVDTSRLRDPAFKQAQVSFLRQKYAGRKVDLVMAGLSSGLDFVLDHREQLFPGAPVVYIAVDQREVKARRLPPDVTGVPIRMELTGTLDTALRLHPGSRRVYVVCGCAPFDAEWEAEARETFRQYEGKLELVYLSGLPMDELLGRVAALPEGSLVYYLHIFRDGAGATHVPAEALERLAERANAPIYGHVGTYVGRGVVGGRVFDFELEGRHAGRLGLRLLKGERPGMPPAAEVSTNADVFDWHQLNRWGIDEANLPSGSVVRNREPSFWKDYKWHVVAAASVCLLQAVLIAGLVVQLVKRRRAEGRLRQVIETAPTGMLLVDGGGAISLVNAQVEKLFGHGRDELVGRPVELLLPDWVRGTCPLGFGQDQVGRRKDGSEFPVEIGVSTVRTPRGLFVLASVGDLTERRRADEEVRAGRRELQVLTGRLLEAQELERRRVARELHDDVNQELALLAIEAELMARPAAGAHPAGAARAGELAARLKELSSAVHDLSHQLHPSKLEHLGLVAAVRGLCKELRQGHGLEVEFIHHPEPGAIPQEVALCLYRIVQEALRNVLRHSGTRRAAVSLAGASGGVSLCVSDDGRGFDPRAAGGGLGLVSMRERLHLVGGEIAIDSRPSGGTRIRVRVPLRPPAPPRVAVPSRPAADVCEVAADLLTEKVP
jgi:PAS domain S-box-containing protein